ncbi:MAG TPA: ATP-binding cassette domain-containing protein [Myxococcaceae bacterium]|nr:ATP-binding cassette domain-containing protein [Myxococcaceae bacterium]
MGDPSEQSRTPAASAAGPVLVLREVSRSFGGVPAVRPVSIEIPRGRTTVLLGESGSGKSTLLRLMAGLLAADSGEILLEGALVTPAGGPALRRRMGFGLQSGGLFPHLTAADNVTLLAQALGRPRSWRARRLEELAALVRLEASVLARWPLELSGGQRQRVSLMRALMLEPAVVLLDEPLGALDPVTRGELQQELLRVFGSLGTTAVLVTHDLQEAAALGDRVALLREGALVQVGPLEMLAAHPADPWVARFLAGWHGGPAR